MNLLLKYFAYIIILFSVFTAYSNNDESKDRCSPLFSGQIKGKNTPESEVVRRQPEQQQQQGRSVQSVGDKTGGGFLGNFFRRGREATEPKRIAGINTQALRKEELDRAKSAISAQQDLDKITLQKSITSFELEKAEYLVSVAKDPKDKTFFQFRVDDLKNQLATLNRREEVVQNILNDAKKQIKSMIRPRGNEGDIVRSFVSMRGEHDVFLSLDGRVLREIKNYRAKMRLMTDIESYKKLMKATNDPSEKVEFLRKIHKREDILEYKAGRGSISETKDFDYKGRSLGTVDIEGVNHTRNLARLESRNNDVDEYNDLLPGLKEQNDLMEANRTWANGKDRLSLRTLITMMEDRVQERKREIKKIQKLIDREEIAKTTRREQIIKEAREELATREAIRG